MSKTAPSAVTLDDDRVLSFWDLGDPHGTPVLLFHGSPQAASCWLYADPVARELGVRAVAPDRPGIGRSTIAPGRRLGDWPRDVTALADALEIDSFGVLGWSAGGPYALACGAALPDRITSVGIAAGTCPLDWPGATDGLNRQDVHLVHLVIRSPRLARAALSSAAAATRLSPPVASRIARHALSIPERGSWQRHARELDDMRFFLDAFQQGAAGVADDYRVYSQPWGFDVSDVRIPTHFWHGDADSLVPLRHAELLSARIPGSEVTVLADTGHLLVYDHLGEMLRTITASPSEA